MLDKIDRGEGTMRDIDLLMSVADNIAGKTLCAFGDAGRHAGPDDHQAVPARIRGARHRGPLHVPLRLACPSTGRGALRASCPCQPSIRLS
jgi:hypothetical protein